MRRPDLPASASALADAAIAAARAGGSRRRRQRRLEHDRKRFPHLHLCPTSVLSEVYLAVVFESWSLPGKPPRIHIVTSDLLNVETDLSIALWMLDFLQLEMQTCHMRMLDSPAKTRFCILHQTFPGCQCLRTILNC